MRNYDDKYKAFRETILSRDGWKCQFPNCRQKKKLQVHHIKKYSESPELEYVKHNCITLCKKHHSLIYGKEKEYEQMFRQILMKDYAIEIWKILRK